MTMTQKISSFACDTHKSKSCFSCIFFNIAMVTLQMAPNLICTHPKPYNTPIKIAHVQDLESFHERPGSYQILKAEPSGQTCTSAELSSLALNL